MTALNEELPPSAALINEFQNIIIRLKATNSLDSGN
jgi:hypothetical protein